MPETCTYEMYRDKSLCKLKFQGLKDIFQSKADMLVEMRRCTGTKSGGFISVAMVMTGDVAVTASPLKWCSTNAEVTACQNENKVCMDLLSKDYAKALKENFMNLSQEIISQRRKPHCFSYA